jgi:dihydroorotate dehydrogenase (NAD+) catalytic subunit
VYGELPVIARLPLERAAWLAMVAGEAGAAAISLAPPRGLLPGPDGSWMRGRLYGPGIFPLALAATREVVALGVPIIAAGGVYSSKNAQALLAAGALGVQVDAALWRGTTL